MAKGAVVNALGNVINQGYDLGTHVEVVMLAVRAALRGQ